LARQGRSYDRVSGEARRGGAIAGTLLAMRVCTDVCTARSHKWFNREEKRTRRDGAAGVAGVGEADPERMRVCKQTEGRTRRRALVLGDQKLSHAAHARARSVTCECARVRLGRARVPAERSCLAATQAGVRARSAGRCSQRNSEIHGMKKQVARTLTKAAAPARICPSTARRPTSHSDERGGAMRRRAPRLDTRPRREGRAPQEVWGFAVLTYSLRDLAVKASE
jgi:hypothetical protein